MLSHSLQDERRQREEHLDLNNGYGTYSLLLSLSLFSLSLSLSLSLPLLNEANLQLMCKVSGGFIGVSDGVQGRLGESVGTRRKQTRLLHLQANNDDKAHS